MDEMYRSGTLKARFMRYFEDHPAKKTWILEFGGSRTQSSLSAEYPGVDVASHSEFTLSGMQGPSMDTSFQALPPDVQMEYDGLDTREMDILRGLLFKMETRKSAKKKAESVKDTSSSPAQNPDQSSSPPSSIVPDPEPSQHIGGRIQQPSKPPRPVVGKLPDGFEPPKDRVVGAQQKEDTRNYKYKSPIETDAAIERVVQAGLANYRCCVKDSVTSRCVGVNAETTSNSLVIEDPVESFLLQNSHVDVYKTIMNDFGDAKVGDRFYVAKDSQSIQAVNAIVGDRVVHSILDRGCSIVAMSDSACNALHLMFAFLFRVQMATLIGR
ncbi:hypothetical protein PM082_024213 [Marasmius tenuissimus]|nr:hypothetical protein PM082_024213 [Marasmius tenuissimus]